MKSKQQHDTSNHTHWQYVKVSDRHDTYNRAAQIIHTLKREGCKKEETRPNRKETGKERKEDNNDKKKEGQQRQEEKNEGQHRRKIVLLSPSALGADAWCLRPHN